MQKTAAIVLFILLGISSLVQPIGCQQPFNLHDMYVQCSEEDPDITPLDFVFEHLLSMEDIVSYFEDEDEQEEGERPHEPFHYIQSSAPYAVAIPKPISLHPPYQQEFLTDKVEYPSSKEDFYHCSFYANIFHPPIV